MQAALARFGVTLAVILGVIVAASAPAHAAAVSVPRVAVHELVGERDDDLAAYGNDGHRSSSSSTAALKSSSARPQKRSR